MKVLVTGGAGFIGHHTVRALQAAGHRAVVFDNLRRGNFARLPAGTPCVEGDVRDADALVEAAAGCEAIVHLAAQADVMGSACDPRYAFETNVTGTWNAARAAQQTGARLVFASSREVYGNPKKLPVREDAPRKPHNTYGLTKCLGEDIVASEVLEVPGLAILRLSNVVGPGDSGRVVPRWIEQAASGMPLTIYGGKQVLDFVPVETVTAAILRCFERGAVDGPINIGSGRGTTLPELAMRLGTAGVEWLPERAVDVQQFVADTLRMRSVLGIAPPADPVAGIASAGASV